MILLIFLGLLWVSHTESFSPRAEAEGVWENSPQPRNPLTEQLLTLLTPASLLGFAGSPSPARGREAVLR